MQEQSKRRHRISGHVWVNPGKLGDVWYAKVRHLDGKRRNHRIGPSSTNTGPGRPGEGTFTKRTAKKQLDAWLVDLERGIDVFGLGVGVREDAGTFGSAAQSWLDWGEHERGWRYSTLVDSTGTVRKWLEPAFAELPLGEITSGMIERWRAEQLSKGGMGRRTSVKCLQMLSAVFNHAIRTQDLTLANPVLKVPKLKDAGYDLASFSFYDQAEVAALLRATEDAQDRALFLLAATTGLRMGELVALRIRDLDFPAELVRVSRSFGHQGGGVVAPKNGRGRSVPLVPSTAAVLARLLQRPNFVGDDDLVFPSATGGFLDRSALRRRYKKAQSLCACGHPLDAHEGDRHAGACSIARCGCQAHRAHLRPLTFHSLRHTFATQVAASGQAPLRELQEWMGHASLAMVLRYSHFSPRPEAAQRLARAFDIEQPEPVEEHTPLQIQLSPARPR
jgi:integrase